MNEELTTEKVTKFIELVKELNEKVEELAKEVRVMKQNVNFANNAPAKWCSDGGLGRR